MPYLVPPWGRCLFELGISLVGPLEAMSVSCYKRYCHLWGRSILSQKDSCTCLMWIASPWTWPVSSRRKMPPKELCRLLCDLWRGHPQGNNAVLTASGVADPQAFWVDEATSSQWESCESKCLTKPRKPSLPLHSITMKSKIFIYLVGFDQLQSLLFLMLKFYHLRLK